MEKIIEELRKELDRNYKARFDIQSARYAVLEEAYMNIIKALHHELSGSICTIEGLVLIELREGSKLRYEKELKLEFEKVRIKRERIQESYIDTTIPIQKEVIYQKLIENEKSTDV